MNEAELLYTFFVNYWDDQVNFGDSQGVTVSARTVRVFGCMVGNDYLQDRLRRWEKEGGVRIIGDCREIPADESCVEVLGYVSKPFAD
jgi:hypothetical protein